MDRGYGDETEANSAAEPFIQGKTRITIRLDDVVIDWFRTRAAKVNPGNYQTLINNALRDYIRQQQEPLEQMLRRILREELSRAATEVNAEGTESAQGLNRGDN
ncbi:MAG: BrnA antitoxin family protein [Cellvibrio sp.]